MRPQLLSEQQLDDFDRDGFLLFRNVFEQKEIDQIISWVNEVQGYPEVPGKHMMYFEKSLLDKEKRILQRMENVYEHHNDFKELFDSDRVKGVVSDLFRESAILFKDKINFKLPGGGGFDWHQDQQAGWWVYAQIFVTALICIDQVTPDNGPLEVSAGHHKQGLIGKEWEPLNDANMKEMKFESVMLEPGDMVFFDSFVPHGSGPNLTDQSRRVLYITYNKLSEGDHRRQYYADKRKSFPPDCERDPKKEYKFRV
jgi:ectoine hydroxylase-related dioxygenase (phytanoyl-CoA dioxygenase family)